MRIETFNHSPELSSIRKTRLYTHLRPYVHERLASVNIAEDLRVREEDEYRLSVEDRYFVKLDILLGQVLKNCKTRQFWKGTMAHQLESEAISCLSVEAIDRAYLSELVVLFERLGRFAVLLRKSFGPRFDVSDLEKKLLSFFSPALFEKRNFAHHRLYTGFPGLTELVRLEEKAVDSESLRCFHEKFFAKVQERVTWYDYTEESLAPFLFHFLESVNQKICQDDEFMAPTDLQSHFSIADRLDVDIRKRYGHEAFYEAVHSNQ